MSESAAPRELSTPQRLGYSAGNLGIGLLPSIVGSWAMYYYAPPDVEGSCLMTYVPMYLIGTMLAIGRIAEALLNPFIGDWSDKTNTRWGRRIPYILIGSPIMVVGMILLWFPPVMGESLINAAWVCGLMVVVSCAFAAVVAPYLSLLPELTPHNDERLTVSAIMALFEVIGVLLAAGGAGLLIDAYRCGVPPFGAQEFNGFQLSGIVFGAITLGAFMLTAFSVKEKPYTPNKQVSFTFLEGIREVFKNHTFTPYLVLATLFRIGMDMVIVAIPYIVTTVMGGEEADAAGVQIVVMVGSILLFPVVNKLSVKFGKKAVTLAGALGFTIILPMTYFVGKVPGIDPMVQGYIVFALATFPVAVFFILLRPLLADIIDYDEKQTGFRREAMYNGMEGLFSRSGSGLAWILSSFLFATFGNSVENPLGILLVGPAGGLLVFGAFLAFTRYPFKK